MVVDKNINLLINLSHTHDAVLIITAQSLKKRLENSINSNMSDQWSELGENQFNMESEYSKNRFTLTAIIYMTFLLDNILLTVIGNEPVNYVNLIN